MAAQQRVDHSSQAAEGSAGEAVSTALRELRDEMLLAQPRAERDEPDGVHELRKLVRRVRSVLGAFGALYDEAVVMRIRREHRRFGRELGAVRDLEVRREFAASAIEDEADAAPALRTRIIDPVTEQYASTHARLVELMASPRADARRTDLDVFLTDPPYAPMAHEGAEDVLVSLLKREAARAVRRTHRAVRRLDRGDADLDELHRARKAGRRLRCAAEAVVERLPDDARTWASKLAAGGEEVHDLLGDHRDQLVFAEVVRRAAAHAAHDGEPGAVYERLADAADAEAAELVSDLPKVVRQLESAADR